MNILFAAKKLLSHASAKKLLTEEGNNFISTIVANEDTEAFLENLCYKSDKQKYDALKNELYDLRNAAIINFTSKDEDFPKLGIVFPITIHEDYKKFQASLTQEQK